MDRCNGSLAEMAIMRSLTTDEYYADLNIYIIKQREIAAQRQAEAAAASKH
jgi:hypothetical protein